MLPTRSALVHLETGHQVPPTPRFFAPYALEFDYRPDAPPPTEWLQFLATVWGTDTAAIETLQEWFGYCLTPDTSQHKILLLVGPPRSGKGTIARVLRRLIGVENTVGPTLASLAESFGLEPLIGKPLAIVGDARLSAKSDRSVVTERLLSLSGEDTLSCNRKNTSYWTGQLPTRLVLLTNETPWLTDSSRALAGRFLVLHMTESFAGREDRALEARLAAELPSILNWAIAGWKRLRARGTFVQPESGKAMVEELRELSSRITTFLADACEIDPSYQEAIPHTYLAWCHWCDQQGESNPGSTRALAKELRTVLPKLSSDKSTKRDGQSLKLFTGLRLSAEYRNYVRGQGHTPLTQPLSQGPLPREGTPGEAQGDTGLPPSSPGGQPARWRAAPPKDPRPRPPFGGATGARPGPRRLCETPPRHRNPAAPPTRHRNTKPSVARQNRTEGSQIDGATGATEPRSSSRYREEGVGKRHRQKQEPQWSFFGGAGGAGRYRASHRPPSDRAPGWWATRTGVGAGVTRDGRGRRLNWGGMRMVGSIRWRALKVDPATGAVVLRLSCSGSFRAHVVRILTALIYDRLKTAKGQFEPRIALLAPRPRWGVWHYGAI